MSVCLKSSSTSCPSTSVNIRWNDKWFWHHSCFHVLSWRSALYTWWEVHTGYRIRTIGARWQPTPTDPAHSPLASSNTRSFLLPSRGFSKKSAKCGHNLSQTFHTLLCTWKVKKKRDGGRLEVFAEAPSSSTAGHHSVLGMVLPHPSHLTLLTTTEKGAADKKGCNHE